MHALLQFWVVAVILAGMFAGGQSLEAQVRAALFGTGANGWQYVIHPNHLRANSDGTGAVALNDPVGWVEDLSGNGNHGTQATSTARPSLKVDGAGRYRLEFDDVDDLVNFGPIDSMGGNRILALAVAYLGSSTQIALGGPSSGGYIGRVSGNHVWSGNVSSGISAGFTPHSIIAYRPGGILNIDGVEVAGGGSPDSKVYSYLASNNTGAEAYGIGFYGGAIAMVGPSSDAVALVKRWLDQLRGA